MALKDNNDINLMDTIRNLVAKAQTGKALDILIKAGNQEAKLLKSRLLDLQQQEKYGKINHQEANVIRNEITNSILEIVCPSDVKPQIVNSIEDKDEMKAHTLVKKSTVLQLIHNNQTERVLLLLQKAGYPKAALWHETYKAKMRLKDMGMLSYKDWDVLQKQMNEDLLTWTYLDESITQKILTDIEKRHIKELLVSNQIAEALHCCKGLGDKSVILLGHYNQMVKNLKLGLLTLAEEKVHLQEISKGIEELIA